MAYAVEILEDDDLLTEDLFIRPTSDYCGFHHRPDNYYEWKPISHVIGDCWFKSGKTKVKELKTGRVHLHYEFMRKCSK